MKAVCKKPYLYAWILPQQSNSIGFMQTHFIAIGGSAMHNLAIALSIKGCQVTGSDDELFDPARTRLSQHALLPDETGWFPEKIHKGLDAVIVGMHAKAKNPELLKAQSLGLPIFSYPEFLYEHAKNKTRIVIGGSHGKTTITSMILHVLQRNRIATDYMVGAQLEGFDVMVKLSDDSPFMVMEGDEYPSAPTDLRPKFHIYKPHIAVISGIAWDHINVYKTFDDYLEQFRKFIHCIEDNGKLIYYESDQELKKLCAEEASGSICLYPYGLPGYEIRDGRTCIIAGEQAVPLRLFGKHNLLNINAARMVTQQLGVADQMFYEAIQSFKGASKRMEMMFDRNGTTVIRDFAHAPSKLKATIEAVREQYPRKQIVACMELHTYSSLSKEFLSEYRGSMDLADKAIVFYSPHALSLKKLPQLKPGDVTRGFNKDGMKVYTSKDELQQALYQMPVTNRCFLFMSSAFFGGLDINEFVRWIDRHY